MVKPSLSLDPNTQKTHYSIDLRSRKRQKTSDADENEAPAISIFQGKYSKTTDKGSEKQPAHVVSENEHTPEKHNTPFVALQAESADHVRHRYALYERVWGHQRAAIENILNVTNNEFFCSLLQYIEDPFSPRLDTAFLALSSNTANNLRLLDEFSSYVSEKAQSGAHLKIVRLNSRICANIKLATREMIKQIVQDSSSDSHTTEEEQPDEGFALKGESDNEHENDYDNDNDDDDEDEDEEDEDEDGNINDHANESADEIENENENENENDDDGDDGAALGALGGRIPYDLDIVQDWMDAYIKKHKCEDALRIAVVLEDSDGFSNEVLNQLLQILCIHTNRYPIKLIMALSSRNVSNWISCNITSRLRLLIEGVKLAAKDNKDIGYQVIDEILLRNEITPENPLLLDAHLSSIILSRFENSNNSIDSLISELKLSYMIHFYQSPLPSLMKPTFVPERFHYDALRKLPSFKTHIEDLVHKLETGPEAERAEIRHRINRLFQSNKELKELFDESRSRIQKYQNAVMNAVNIVYWVCGGSTAKFHIYKLITNNRLINSVFFSGVLKKLTDYDEDDFDMFVAFLYGSQIHGSIDSQEDEDIEDLRLKLKVSTAGDLKDLVTEYFHANRHLNMKTSDNLFNEVLTISGGRSELDELKPRVSIEENYENLMINLIRPNTRERIEIDLDEPQNALRNPLIMHSIGQKKKASDLLGPPLCKLYQVYKDAPVSINLWDFFVAFQQSLAKPQLISEIDRHLETATDETKSKLSSIVESVKQDEEAWEKLTYSWFLQGCYELNMMGFLKEKVKGDFMEKLVWKNL